MRQGLANGKDRREVVGHLRTKEKHETAITENVWAVLLLTGWLGVKNTNVRFLTIHFKYILIVGVFQKCVLDFAQAFPTPFTIMCLKPDLFFSPMPFLTQFHISIQISYLYGNTILLCNLEMMLFYKKFFLVHVYLNSNIGTPSQPS